MSAIYDNWERLVAAVVKKQQLWELFHQQSRSPSILSDASDFSFDFPTPGRSWSSQKSPPKLVLISDFWPAFDVRDVTMASTELTLLGKGTFGSAYVDDGRRFVVKRLMKSEAISELDFKRNMEIVADVRHDNVVALRAYYSSTDHKLVLYDYYSNGSVYSLLHGENRADLDWVTRLKIAIGAARGIAEIHTEHDGMHVHGNIKASNIFLNLQSYGCVSDFGLPYITKTTQNISQASDVYGFGILLLELLTRKPTAHVPGGGPAAVDLVKLVNSVKTKEMAAKVFDPDLLKHPTISEEMIKMLQIGLRCVAKSEKERPKIFEVVNMLEDIVGLNHVSRPLYSTSQEEKLVFLEDGDHIFEFEHLLEASTELLGKGSFGTCYKTKLYNGNIVVMKRLRKVTATFKEFQQHMEVFGRMSHINVGRLKAYFYTRDDKLLVYDYCNQGSLSSLLHGTNLEWGSRVKIALGAARGVAYIHGQDGRRLVLGNIKSSNILLNGENSSIGFDAGLAELMNPVRLSCIPSPDYCAPEATSGKVSQASDVYSFGVVLLELAFCGRSPSLQLEDCGYGAAASLAEWIRSVDMSKWTAQVLDVESLRRGRLFLWLWSVGYEMMQLLQIAKSCVSIVPEHRPSIFQVVKALEEIGEEVEPESSVQSRLECMAMIS
ncbi:hypothetical protein C2S53_020648 [Perilla frutescens var. hirtella]|uniref:Protein kinase domain-containing protein n=1 Tax=Perilla frutescens var. hirtella TaxID=608512 RepID=A0AAD4ILM0_PERFH|nr:hypothetical protein C2S53_020648 [Perilla frutescens var. hirtella]